MIAGDFQLKLRPALAFVAITASLLMSACGGSASRVVTAQTACTTLSGKSIGGATLTTEVIPPSGKVPM